mmetsp:Transcript_13678/g.54813  ORF Transcript_13678/g.54813 Transcript_13678/m.54813 type:complete len:90 (-) Transcript_13678:29-298(-)
MGRCGRRDASVFLCVCVGGLCCRSSSFDDSCCAFDVFVTAGGIIFSTSNARCRGVFIPSQVRGTRRCRLPRDRSPPMDRRPALQARRRR